MVVVGLKKKSVSSIVIVTWTEHLSPDTDTTVTHSPPVKVEALRWVTVA